MLIVQNLFAGLIFTKNRNGKPQVIFGGYKYNRYCKSHGPKIRWVCTKGGKCFAALYTLDGQVIKIPKEHVDH